MSSCLIVSRSSLLTRLFQGCFCCPAVGVSQIVVTGQLLNSLKVAFTVQLLHCLKVVFTAQLLNFLKFVFIFLMVVFTAQLLNFLKVVFIFLKVVFTVQPLNLQGHLYCPAVELSQGRLYCPSAVFSRSVLDNGPLRYQSITPRI